MNLALADREFGIWLHVKTGVPVRFETWRGEGADPNTYTHPELGPVIGPGRYSAISREEALKFAGGETPEPFRLTIDLESPLVINNNSDLLNYYNIALASEGLPKAEFFPQGSTEDPDGGREVRAALAKIVGQMRKDGHDGLLVNVPLGSDNQVTREFVDLAASEEGKPIHLTHFEAGVKVLRRIFGNTQIFELPRLDEPPLTITEPPATEPPATEPPAGELDPESQNTVFTPELVNQARENLKKKLGSTMMGLDPTVLADLIIIGGGHIEPLVKRGVANFSSWAQRTMDEYKDILLEAVQDAIERRKTEPPGATVKTTEEYAADVEERLKAAREELPTVWSGLLRNKGLRQKFGESLLNIVDISREATSYYQKKLDGETPQPAEGFSVTDLGFANDKEFETFVRGEKVTITPPAKPATETTTTVPPAETTTTVPPAETTATVPPAETTTTVPAAETRDVKPPAQRVEGDKMLADGAIDEDGMTENPYWGLTAADVAQFEEIVNEPIVDLGDGDLKSFNEIFELAGIKILPLSKKHIDLGISQREIFPDLHAENADGEKVPTTVPGHWGFFLKDIKRKGGQGKGTYALNKAGHLRPSQPGVRGLHPEGDWFSAWNPNQKKWGFYNVKPGSVEGDNAVTPDGRVGAIRAQLSEIVDRLRGSEIAEFKSAEERGRAEVTRVRSRELGQGMDRRRTSEELTNLTSGGTREILRRGTDHGVPAQGIEFQIQNIGAIVSVYDNGQGLFILAEPAGTGKTFTLGGVMRELGPKTLNDFLYVTTSEKTVQQVRKDLKAFELELNPDDGTNRTDLDQKPNVHLTTYGKLVSDPQRFSNMAKGKVLILDEAHRGKNEAAATGGVVRELIKNADFVIASSATPFGNVNEAAYLKQTGAWDTVEVNHPSMGIVRGHTAWAFMFGSEIVRNKKYVRPGGEYVTLAATAIKRIQEARDQSENVFNLGVMPYREPKKRSQDERNHPTIITLKSARGEPFPELLTIITGIAEDLGVDILLNPEPGLAEFYEEHGFQTHLPGDVVPGGKEGHLIYKHRPTDEFEAQWAKRQDERELQMQANDWLLRAGIYVAHESRLDPALIIQDLVKVTVDPEWPERFVNVLAAYDTAMSTASGPVKRMIQMHREGLQQRILEASKIVQGIEYARGHIDEGKQVLLFVTTRSPRWIGRYATAGGKSGEGYFDIHKRGQNANWALDQAPPGAWNEMVWRLEGEHQEELRRSPDHTVGKATKRHYTALEIEQIMGMWQQEYDSMPDDSATGFTKGNWLALNPPPFGQGIEAIAAAMAEHGIDEMLPAVVDHLREGLERDDPDHKSIAPEDIKEFHGGLKGGATKLTRQVQEWKDGIGDALIVTMAMGGTGLSYHDTTGDMPRRVQINLNLPWSSNIFTQTSGRLARYGIKKPVEVYWLFADNIPFEQHLSTLVGNMIAQQQAVLAGTLDTATTRVEEFDLTDADQHELLLRQSTEGPPPEPPAPDDEGGPPVPTSGPSGPSEPGGPGELITTIDLPKPRVRLQGKSVVEGGTPAERAVEQIEGLGPRNPLNAKEIVFDGAKVEVRTDLNDPNGIVLGSIAALEQGQGAGSSALEKIISIADEYGVHISLVAVPYGLDTGDREESDPDVFAKAVTRLVNWYKKYGFEEDGPNTAIEGEQYLIREAGGAKLATESEDRGGTQAERAIKQIEDLGPFDAEKGFVRISYTDLQVRPDPNVPDRIHLRVGRHPRRPDHPHPSFFTRPHGQDQSTIEKLTSIADKESVSIVVVAVPFVSPDEPDLDLDAKITKTDAIIGRYQKHGFEEEGKYTGAEGYQTLLRPPAKGAEAEASATEEPEPDPPETGLATTPEAVQDISSAPGTLGELEVPPEGIYIMRAETGNFQETLKFFAKDGITKLGKPIGGSKLVYVFAGNLIFDAKPISQVLKWMKRTKKVSGGHGGPESIEIRIERKGEEVELVIKTTGRTRAEHHFPAITGYAIEWILRDIRANLQPGAVVHLLGPIANEARTLLYGPPTAGDIPPERRVGVNIVPKRKISRLALSTKEFGSMDAVVDFLEGNVAPVGIAERIAETRGSGEAWSAEAVRGRESEFLGEDAPYAVPVVSQLPPDNMRMPFPVKRTPAKMLAANPEKPSGQAQIGKLSDGTEFMTDSHYILIHPDLSKVSPKNIQKADTTREKHAESILEEHFKERGHYPRVLSSEIATGKEKSRKTGVILDHPSAETIPDTLSDLKTKAQLAFNVGEDQLLAVPRYSYDLHASMGFRLVYTGKGRDETPMLRIEDNDGNFQGIMLPSSDAWVDPPDTAAPAKSDEIVLRNEWSTLIDSRIPEPETLEDAVDVLESASDTEGTGPKMKPDGPEDYGSMGRAAKTGGGGRAPSVGGRRSRRGGGRNAGGTIIFTEMPEMVTKLTKRVAETLKKLVNVIGEGRGKPVGVKDPAFREFLEDNEGKPEGRLDRMVNGLLDMFWYERVIKDFPKLQNDVRLFRGELARIPTYTDEKLLAVMEGIKGPEDYAVFNQIILLQDMIGEKLAERTVSRDFSLEQLEAELANQVKVAEGLNPAILKAVERHKALVREMGEDLIRRGKISPEDLKKDYFPHIVLDFARSMAASITGAPYIIREPFRGYSKKRKGTERDIETDYIEGMWRHVSSVQRHNEIDDFIEQIVKTFDRKPELTKEERKLLQFNKPYYIDGMPHVLWQPDPGRAAYPVQTIPEKLVRDAISRNLADVTVPVSDVKPGLAIGGWKKSFLIPVDIATRLNQFNTEGQPNWLMSEINMFTRAWKSLTILFGGPKWQIFNMMGDMANLYREDPAALLNLLNPMLQSKALREIKAAARGEPSEMYQEIAKQQVVEIGPTYVSELGGNTENLAEMRSFRTGFRGWLARTILNMKSAGLVTQKLSYLLAPAQTFRDVAQVREEIVRLAKAMADYHRIKRGEPVKATKRLIGGLDPKSFAAMGKVAREFTIDYGKFTEAENRWIRGFLLPFWSWTKQNFPNWAAYAVTKPLGLALKFGIPMIAASMWNNSGERREVEESLDDWKRESPHLITGFRDSRGRAIVLYYTGHPLVDAMDLIGIGSITTYMEEMQKGNMTLDESSMELVKDIKDAPKEAFTNLLTPAFKVPGELLSNRRWWSDRPIVSEGLKKTPVGKKRRGIHVLETVFRPVREARALGRFLAKDDMTWWDFLNQRWGMGLPIGYEDVQENLRRKAGQQAFDATRETREIRAYHAYQIEEELREYLVAKERGNTGVASMHLERAQEIRRAVKFTQKRFDQILFDLQVPEFEVFRKAAWEASDTEAVSPRLEYFLNLGPREQAKLRRVLHGRPEMLERLILQYQEDKDKLSPRQLENWQWKGKRGGRSSNSRPTSSTSAPA